MKGSQVVPGIESDIQTQMIKMYRSSAIGWPDGEERLNEFASQQRRRTIAGYIEERIRSPYVSPKIGSNFKSLTTPAIESDIFRRDQDRPNRDARLAHRANLRRADLHLFLSRGRETRRRRASSLIRSTTGCEI
jgi:hypothetical protein